MKRMGIWVAVLGLGLCGASAQTTSGRTSSPPGPPVNLARAADLPSCEKKQLLGYVPSNEEIKAHRRFELPVIKYPFGTTTESSYRGGLGLILRVDPSGNVVCFSLANSFGEKQLLNQQRRTAISDIRSWRYTPFALHDNATAAVVAETIREEELPKANVPTPEVALAQVHIGLERGMCFGPCPAYKVDLYGDGHAIYVGGEFVDVVGEHRYSIAPEAVAKLVRSLRDKNLWSLRESYQAHVTDMPTYKVTLQLGDQTHSIFDYAGRMVGMPASVSEFENEIDDAAGSQDWIRLSPVAVAYMKTEGYAFSSAASGELLRRATENTNPHNDDAMVELVDLGAPLDVATRKGIHDWYEDSLIDLALKNRHEKLAKVLIQKGALKTNNKVVQEKLDTAFRAAIAGGRLSLVQTIWDVAAPARPALMFLDHGSRKDVSEKESPVTLLLQPPYPFTKAWQGREIAMWLSDKGCDLAAHGADGRTLLHIASDANDPEFVQYLLTKGIDPSTPGFYGLPPLGSTHNEEVAMLLLEAGANTSKLRDNGGGFRSFAEGNHWQRVVTWLNEHENPK